MIAKTGSNRTWPLSYAAFSIAHQRTKCIGIVLLLAIGITLPATVFTWSETSLTVAVEQYYEENTFQLSVVAKTTSAREDFMNLPSLINDLEYVEKSHFVASTVGLFNDQSFGEFRYYIIDPPFPSPAIVRDFRVLIMDHEAFTEFSKGLYLDENVTLSPGEILISAQTVDYAANFSGIEIEIGDMLNVDIITRKPVRYDLFQPFSREDLGTVTINNLTVAGFYNPKKITSVVGKEFYSLSRPISETHSIPVLGLNNSIILLSDNLNQEVIETVSTSGFFEPAVFVRTSPKELLSDGVNHIENNLYSLIDRISELDLRYRVEGVLETGKLAQFAEIYDKSRILVMMSVPILFTSMLLIVYTAESSVHDRIREIRVLRSKGASFTQIINSMMYESIFLAIFGLILGVLSSFVFSSVMGSATGLFVLNINDFIEFFSNITVPFIVWPIIGGITLLLPMMYLVQIERNISVGEIGQPDQPDVPEEILKTSHWKSSLVLLGLLVVSLLVPYIVDFFGLDITLHLIIVSLILLPIAYASSKFVQQSFAYLSSFVLKSLGEKRLYVTQSVSRRKGKFIPLMIILTLSLTTTTMVLIEGATFDQTLRNELEYAYGADMRIESSIPRNPYTFADELESVDFIASATPVVECYAKLGGHEFLLQGIDPISYLHVGHFKSTSFVNTTQDEVLQSLAEDHRGIILPESIAKILGKDIGDRVTFRIGYDSSGDSENFWVVGLMDSLPGFGVAAKQERPTSTLSEIQGSQVIHNFAIVDVDRIFSFVRENGCSKFLCSANINSTFERDCKYLEENIGRIEIKSPYFSDVLSDFDEIRPFISGIQGFVTVVTVMCFALAIASIGLFFGSAINERRAEYAIFRALGATRKQVTSLVISEFAGIIVSVITVSTLIGFLFGYSLSVVIFGISPFAPILPIITGIPILVALIVFSVEWGTMIGACLFPALRAGNIPIVQELRNL